MSKKLSTGERVTWELSGGETSGADNRRVTGTMHLKRQQVTASNDQPESLVKSSEKAVFPTEALNQCSG